MTETGSDEGDLIFNNDLHQNQLQQLAFPVYHIPEARNKIVDVSTDYMEGSEEKIKSVVFKKKSRKLK